MRQILVFEEKKTPGDVFKESTNGIEWENIGETMPFWEPNTAYGRGDKRVSYIDELNGTPYYLRCTTAGTSAASQPEWSIGDNIGDAGSLVWSIVSNFTSGTDEPTWSSNKGYYVREADGFGVWRMTDPGTSNLDLQNLSDNNPFLNPFVGRMITDGTVTWRSIQKLDTVLHALGWNEYADITISRE